MRELPEWERDNPGELYRRAFAGPPVKSGALSDRQKGGIPGKPNIPDAADTLPHARKYSVPLDCAHRAIYVSPSPVTGDVIYCRKCGNYRVVTGRSREVLNH